jgi:oligopeptide transport system substrate-binding protein
MKKKLALFSLILGMILLSACSDDTGKSSSNNKDGKSDQVLNVPLGSEPASLHPGQISEMVSVNLITQVFEGFTRIGKDGQPEKAMAKEISISDDQTVYTFTLQDDAKWSNGDPLTAEDFAYAWKHTLNPDNPQTPKVSRLYAIKNAEKAKAGEVSLDEVGIKVVDEKTLEVTLENPTDYFLKLTASTLYYPINKKIAEKNPDWYVDASEDFVSNGPFKLTQWEHQSKIVLEKNENYWDKDTVRLEKVNFHIGADANTNFSMFKSGDLDYAGDPLGVLPLQALDSLRQEGTLTSEGKSGTYYYLFNVNKEPFTNKNIRKAFALAMDRNAITQNITKGGETPAMAIVQPTIWEENAEGYFKDNDIEQAKKYLSQGLQELGLKDVSELPPVTISFNTSDAHAAIAQAIQDMWKKNLGVEVSLDNTEFQVVLDNFANGKYQIGRLGQTAEIDDALPILEAYRANSSFNYTNWSNQDFIRLLDEAKKETDSDARKDLLKQAEEILMEEMPMAPIYYYRTNYTQKDYLKDVYISGLGFIQLKWAYIEK